MWLLLLATGCGVLPEPTRSSWRGASVQWTSCLCVLVRSTHTGVQVWTTAALSSSFYQFKVQWYKLWVLGLLMAKCQEDQHGGLRRMCLGRTEPEKKKRQRPLPDFIEPLVIVIKYLWRILSQSSLHITKTIVSSYLPKWTIFLHDKRHCLYPQCPSKTYICMDLWLT